MKTSFVIRFFNFTKFQRCRSPFRFFIAESLIPEPIPGFPKVSDKVIVPKSGILKKYQKIGNETFQYKDVLKREIQKLRKLENLILSKMTKVETEKEMN